MYEYKKYIGLRNNKSLENISENIQHLHEYSKKKLELENYFHLFIIV